jgi:hypothetical protein
MMGRAGQRVAVMMTVWLWALSAQAQLGPNPVHTFEAGSPARAAEINANFDRSAQGEAALGERLDALAATVAAQQAEQAALTGRVEAAEQAAADATARRDALTAQLTAAEAAAAALTDRLTALEASEADLRERLGAATLQSVALQTRADTTDTTLSAIDQRLDTLDTELDTRDADLEAALEAAAAERADLEDRLIIDTNRITVDPDGVVGAFTGVQEAWAWLATRHVPAGRTLVIKLQPGTYVINGALALDHPDGGRIFIEGERNDPSLVRLRFSGSDGITLSAGHSIGGLEGLTLDGEPGAGGQRGYAGLVVKNGAHLVLGRNVVVTRFVNGALVRGGAFLSAEAGFKLLNNQNHGLWVSRGATADVPEVESSDNGGNGLFCEHHCLIYATDCTLLRNAESGSHTRVGAVVDLNHCTIEDNAEWGVLADFASVARATSSTIQRNAFAGVQIQGGTYGSVSSSRLLGNNTRNAPGSAQLVVSPTAYAAVGGTFRAEGNGITLPPEDQPRTERPVSTDNQ